MFTAEIRYANKIELNLKTVHSIHKKTIIKACIKAS